MRGVYPLVSLSISSAYFDLSSAMKLNLLILYRFRCTISHKRELFGRETEDPTLNYLSSLQGAHKNASIHVISATIPWNLQEHVFFRKQSRRVERGSFTPGFLFEWSTSVIWLNSLLHPWIHREIFPSNERLPLLLFEPTDIQHGELPGNSFSYDCWQ